MTAVATSPASQAADLIIRGQMRVVGKTAYKLAKRVPGLKVVPGGVPELSGDEVEVLDRLVREYSSITGTIGARICFMSAAPVLKAHPELRIPALAEFQRG